MTTVDPSRPSVVLICHHDEPLDFEGIAAWLATDFSLAGIVLLRDPPATKWHKLRREYRRVGLLRLLDVVLFRLYYQLRQARSDALWVRQAIDDLRVRYSVDLSGVPSLVAASPRDPKVRDFIADLQPDFALARCKHILQTDVFTLPRCGTYVLHPGICPLYRNAHGCFWALANRDLENVGMTLLKVDSGIDTGPVFLQASYPFDEARESHVRIQQRVVMENLDAITRQLRAICSGGSQPLILPLQKSTNWGQPWLTAYLHWQRRLRETQRVSS